MTESHLLGESTNSGQLFRQLLNILFTEYTWTLLKAYDAFPDSQYEPALMRPSALRPISNELQPSWQRRPPKGEGSNLKKSAYRTIALAEPSHDDSLTTA